jgi:hypothetical protein
MCLGEAVEEAVEEARAPQEKQPAPAKAHATVPAMAKATPWVLAMAKEMGLGMDS